MRDYYTISKTIMSNTMEDWKSKYLSDPTDPDYGFVRLTGGYDINGISYWCFSVYFVAAYYLEGTKSYHDEELLKLALMSIDRSNRYVYEDGTMDLHETNTHDPTTAAFAVRDYIGPAIEIMIKHSTHTELEDKVYNLLVEALLKMSKAMETLGFHTPNHRWIICSALSYTYKFFGDEKALETINKFLMEGIDCDENGEFTERSAGMYNVVCDRSFLQMYHLWGKKEYLDCVDRNLKLMRSFIEPDKTMCTMNSMRQDIGYNVKNDIYNDVYFAMAYYTKDPEYAYYIEQICRDYEAEQIRTNGAPQYGASFFQLYFFLVEPEFPKLHEKIDAYLPDRNLNIFLEKSGMVREYNGDTTLSISCGRTPDFVKYMVGNSDIYIRGGASFFGQPHAQFRPHKIEKTEKGYRLYCHEEAGYRSQLDEPPATSEWRLMDHSKRKIINVQTLDCIIDVNPTSDGFEIEADVKCTGQVMSKLEIQFKPNLMFASDTLTFVGPSDGYMYYKSGSLFVRFSERVIYEITGGGAEFSGADHLRGTEQVRGGSFTLCVNGRTPCKLKFAMKKVDVKQNPVITKKTYKF